MSLAFVSLLSGTLLRSTILAAFCGLLLWAFRVRAAEIRHLMWRGVLMALLLLPVLQIGMPPLRQASKAAIQIESALAPVLSPGNDRVIQRPPLSNPLHEAARKEPSWPVAALDAYFLVLVGLLARLVMGLLRLKTIVDGSEFVADERIHRLAHEAWLQTGAGIKPQVRVSRDVAVPVAIASGDAFILVPRSWVQWDEEKLRAVMMHEMAHVSRGDPAVALTASFATCIFWFHPLAWFLRRQLSTLAEEACDEIALRTVSRPEHYARILSDFAFDIARQRGRMPESASAAVHSSQIKKRLTHVYAAFGHAPKSRRALRALLITILLPAIYLTAAARFDGMQAQNEPENLKLQEKLLDQYLQQGDGAGFTQGLVEVIQHHPDSDLACMMTSVVVQAHGPIHSPEDLAAVKSAWEQVLAQYPGSPGAHWGAGICVEQSNPARALALLRQGRKLAGNAGPDKYLSALGMIYGASVIADLHLGDPRFRVNDIAMSLNTATILRAELEESGDSALLSKVGTMLVSLAESPNHDSQSELGLGYLQRAVDLDPTNPKWAEALEAAKAQPARRRALAAIMATVRSRK